MARRPLLSKLPKFLKNERWKPYIRYQKETDTWITKAIQEKSAGDEEMEETMGKIISKIRILMDRPQLDIISRLVAYLYHDKIDDYKEIASDLRKDQIQKDLKEIDQWLDIQYSRLTQQEEKDKKFNKVNKEILNEQPKQSKGKYL